MRIQTILIMALMASLIAISFASLIDDMSTRYGVNTNTSTLYSIQRINETYDFTVTAGQTIDKETENVGQEGITGILTFSEKLLNAVKTFISSVQFIPSMITNGLEPFKLPSWFTYTMLAIGLLVLLISLLYLIGIIRSA